MEWGRGDLARLGFLEAGRAQADAARLAGWGEPLVDRLVTLCAAAADPDQALATLAGLADTPDLGDWLADPGFAARLVAVTGASAALARWLIRWPADLAYLREEPHRRPAAELTARLLAAVAPDDRTGADHTGEAAGSSPAANAWLPAADALRHAYRAELLRISARDLTAADPAAELGDIAAELADLADATVEAALAIARRQYPGSEKIRLAVIALGKCGAQELNYLSDVDVIYLAEPALDQDGQPLLGHDEAIAGATQLVALMSQITSAHTAAGTIWSLDPNLRPEGRQGALVRSLAGVKRYYTSVALNWEFQAMLKARPMAGDLALGAEFTDFLQPLVWNAAQRPNFMADTQALRQRVIAHIPVREQGREIKLGAGGLRDTEFSVQLLQLVHGRLDPRLRLTATLEALAALKDHGYIGREDGAGLDEAYRFQRLLEHRVQLSQLLRTHLMPEDEVALRRLARSVGLPDAAAVSKRWRETSRLVQRLHQRVFYSPLLETVARIPTEEARLTPEAAHARLSVLGYADPAAALRHIEALTAGLSRRAEIQRQLLPAMLAWFTAGPNPDLGLLAFRQLSDALGNSPFYLRALRDEGATAERLAKLLATSRYVSNLLLRHPQSVELLGADAIAPIKGRATLVAEMTAVVGHHGEAGSSQALRTVRRRELARLSMADVLGQAEIRQVGHELAAIADASIEAAYVVARRVVDQAPRMAVIALGRWGGGEMSYSSDADLIYVVEDSPDPAVTRRGLEVVNVMRQLLKAAGPDPDLELDADLRPEGRDGPIVRSLSSYLAYYARWSSAWEAQALLRARPGAGDEALATAWIEGIGQLRYPAAGLSREHLLEIRKLKSRMEAERMPRGINPRHHVKLGPGGLTDVEWTIQLLQMQHAAELPELRTPNTLGALQALADHDLVQPGQAEDLAAAWLMASRIRNAIMLLTNRGADVLPSADSLGQVAEMLGYQRGQASLLTDDWDRLARRARRVMDQLFWEAE